MNLKKIVSIGLLSGLLVMIGCSKPAAVVEESESPAEDTTVVEEISLNTDEEALTEEAADDVAKEEVVEEIPYERKELLKKTETMWSSDDEPLARTDFEYKDNVELQSYYYIYDGEWELANSAEFISDENGNLIKTQIISNDGTPSTYWLYEYDENGNVLTQTSYNVKGKEMEKTTYYYDENGNQYKGKRERTFDNYFETFSIKIPKCEYDDEGKKISEVNDTGYGYECLTEYFYDNHGNLIKYTIKNRYGELCLTVENELDKYGNIVKITSTENGYDGIEVTITEIEYYDEEVTE